ncbi:MAG: sensor histidine kinase [Gemmatimonadota bacterium]|nr:sensor histidine kinase [Gemmatimonadota bacterium]
MRPTDSQRTTVGQALFVFGAWTFLAAFSSSQTVVYLMQRGQPVVWRDMLTGRFADWYTCALFTPLFFWLARRYPIDKKSWRMSLPITLAVTSVCVVLKYSLLVPIEHLLGLNLKSSIGSELSRNFANESMAFWAVIGIIHAFEFNRRYRERELAAADLRVRLSEAQLEALRSQIHPHFLFNTLHSISTLMHRDVEAADTMLTRLSDLLRLTLKHRGENEITLREELALADHYLDIMRVRFGDRLAVTKSISPNAQAMLVPQFVLQPLLENALEHGVATTSGPGTVHLSAVETSERLELSVTDNGRGGIDASLTGRKHGLGLANTRLRLEQLYGRSQSISLEKLPGSGTRITVSIPLRTSTQSQPSHVPSVA